MFTLRRLSVLLVLLVVAVPGWAAENDRYLPNSSEGIITINIKQLLGSAVLKEGVEQAKLLVNAIPDVKKVLDDIGLDPFNDLKRIVVAGAGEQQALILIDGKFNVTKLEAKADALAKEQKDHVKVIMEGTSKIYETDNPQGGQKMYVTVVNDQTIVASTSKDFVVEVLDKKAGKKKGELNKDLQELLSKTDPMQTLSLALLTASMAKQGGQAKDFADKVKNITGGFAVTDMVKMDLVLAVKDIQDTKPIAEVIKEGLNQGKAFVGLMAAQQKELTPLVDLIEGIKVTTSGTAVVVKGEVTKEQIEKAKKKQ